MRSGGGTTERRHVLENHLTCGAAAARRSTYARRSGGGIGQHLPCFVFVCVCFVFVEKCEVLGQHLPWRQNIKGQTFSPGLSHRPRLKGL